MPEKPLYSLLSLSRLRMDIDGRGVTTLIAGAGCPLKCRWCINKRLLREGKYQLIDAPALVDKLRIDHLYFLATGGGVTFGGGEALLHAEFIRAFRKVCPEGWKITAETSLAVPEEQVRIAMECVDDFIVDCKDMDPKIYHRYTGGDGALMQSNLRLLLAHVGPERVMVRVPLIPWYNTAAHQARSAELLRQMGVTRLDLFKYMIRNKE